MSPNPQPEPIKWDDLSGLLEASITHINQRRMPSQAPAVDIAKPQTSSTLAQLVSDCGIAAIDGYLAIRDYAESKGLDLLEFSHKGIDLQDLISTLVIHTRTMAEQSGGTRRYGR